MYPHDMITISVFARVCAQALFRPHVCTYAWIDIDTQSLFINTSVEILTHQPNRDEIEHMKRTYSEKSLAI